jgi:hypothetical protein
LAVGSQNVFSIYAARLPAASEMIMEIAGDEDDLEKVNCCGMAHLKIELN